MSVFPFSHTVTLRWRSCLLIIEHKQDKEETEETGTAMIREIEQ